MRLNPEWDRAQENEISTQELARSIAVKMRALEPFSDDPMTRSNEWDTERDEIAETFESLADDENATQSDFNRVMCALYDWGDTGMDARWNGRKVCFVDHMSPVPA